MNNQPSEYVYYKYDCVDLKKSETSKTFAFEIYEKMVEND